MPSLPTPGDHWIEPASAHTSAPAQVVAIQNVGGVKELIPGGVSQYEFVDLLGTGTFTLVAAGTSPGQPRKSLVRIGTTTYVI